MIDMGGRKVCFIDYNGQAGTCIRDDENCLHCDSGYKHYNWFRKEVRRDMPEKVAIKTQVDYHTKICEQVHVLEQTVYGMRDLASSMNRIGLEKVADELYWRAGNIEEVMEKTDHLILEFLKQERKNLEIVNAQLKQINENIDCKMCSMPHMKTIKKILNE
jgi:hypothetical protein